MSQLMSMTDLEIPASEFTPSMVMDLLIDHAHELWIDPDTGQHREYLRGLVELVVSFIGPPGREGATTAQAQSAMSMCEDLIRYGRRK